jgi:iron complex outermembrane receptor protein
MRGLSSSLALACAAGALLTPAYSSDDTAEKEPVLTERVTVTASRLPDEPDDANRVPASVTVISREQIERSGVANLADLLAFEAGAVRYDQTGNGVQTTFDMRGFTTGSGTRVFLDGAPLNDAINNTLALELVSLQSLDRIEITRGSAAALAGGGSEAGVINLFTRRGEELGGSLSMSLGTFESSNYGGHLSHDTGLVDFVISGTGRETDGFRDNADGDLRRLSATVGFDLSEERRLDVTLVDSASDFGNPGALTEDELAVDRSAALFNMLDFADERLGLASVNFRGPIAEKLTLAANVFARNRETNSLTTGRAAPVFGGFALDADASFWGSTVQVSHRHAVEDRLNVMTFGGEWLDGDTESLGFSTPFDDPGSIPTDPSTDTKSDRRSYALFTQDTWTPSADWTLMAGARYDRDRVGRNESLPDSSNDGSRTFSELSLRAGATWNPNARHAVYASYGEGFLAPTTEDLFAFPGFGSNPDLDPEDSRSYELGYRVRSPRALLDIGVFRIDTENEIVYDPDSPIGPFGANVNAGRTERQGVEISLRGRVLPRLDLSAALTLTDAEFTAGDNDGNEVPLVPGERLALGMDLGLAAGLALHGDALFVGEQVLDNDDTNSQPLLDDYVVVNARVVWRLAGLTTERNGLRLFAGARNLLDEEYATRGIYAFDFSSGMNDTFFTPAPGRRYEFGAGWDF